MMQSQEIYYHISRVKEDRSASLISVTRLLEMPL